MQKAINAAFNAIDQNKDGEISREQVTNALNTLKINTQGLDASVFNKFDADGNGSINKNELCGIVSYVKGLAGVKSLITKDDTLFASGTCDNLGTAQQKLIKLAFNYVDSDSDGLISQSQVQAVLTKLKLSNFNLDQAAFKRYDVNGDGSLDLDEFCGIIVDIKNRGQSTDALILLSYETDAVSLQSASQCDNLGPVQQKAVKAAFNLVDTDKDGFITLTQVQNLLAKLKLTSLNLDQAAFNRYDINDDGSLDLDEFCGIVVDLKKQGQAISGQALFEIDQEVMSLQATSQCDNLGPAARKAAQIAFNAADLDDGYLTQEQLQNLLTKLKLSSLNLDQAAFNKFDTDSDGKISLSELCGIIVFV